MRNDWQNVDDKKPSYRADQTQNTSYLWVEYGDEGRHDEDYDVDTVEYLVMDLLVSEEQLEAEGAQEVIDKREAAEEQHEQGETHDKGEGV